MSKVPRQMFTIMFNISPEMLNISLEMLNISPEMLSILSEMLNIALLRNVEHRIC